MSDPTNPDEIINPIDLQKSAKLLSGASASEVRQALRSFNDNNIFGDAPTPIQQQATAPPLVDPLVPTSFSDVLPRSGANLDPGVPRQLPVSSNGNDDTNPPVTVTVTGVLNGVAASGEALFTADPTPL